MSIEISDNFVKILTYAVTFALGFYGIASIIFLTALSINRTARVKGIYWWGRLALTYMANNGQIKNHHGIAMCMNQIIKEYVDGRQGRIEEVSKIVREAAEKIPVPVLLPEDPQPVVECETKIVKKAVTFYFDEKPTITFNEMLTQTGRSERDFTVVDVLKDGQPSTVLIPKY